MDSVIGYESINGNIVSFETDVAEKIKNLKINIESVQAGSGDPSPENVRPIRGWAGVSISRTGVNVWDEEWETGNIDPNTGQDKINRTAICSKNYILIKPNTQYYFCYTGSNNGNNWRSRFYDVDKNYIGTGGTLLNNAVFTTPADAFYVRFCTQSTYGGTYQYDISINYPQTDTEYHAYSGETYDIAFPAEAGEVYGGTLDVITGELVVDRMIKVVDGSVVGSIVEFSTGQQGTTHLYKVAESYLLLPVTDYSSDYMTNLFSSNTASFNTDRIGSYIYNKTLRFRLPENIADTPETVRAWLANNPLQIVYPLDEPITYQLTPLEIQTIIGTNNIYATTGNTSVIYPKTITPIKIMSNVSLMELRRNIITAQAYGKTADVTLNLGTHQVYPTDSIESLRKYLTVVSRGSGTSVTDYTLHGSIDTVGNHQIIIDCHPGIATIQVPVVTNPSGILYEWDFTKSLTDERQNYTAILKTGEADEVPGKSVGTTPPVRGDTGVVFNDAQQALRLLDSNIQSGTLLKEKTVQIDVAYFNFVYNNTSTTVHERARFIMFGDPVSNNGSMLYTSGIKLFDDWGWYFVMQERDGMTQEAEPALLTGKNAISGHTISIYINPNRTINFYVDGTYKVTTTSSLPVDFMGFQIGAGGRPTYGGAFYNARITGVRIYNGEVTS